MKEHAERIATGTAAIALLAVLVWRFLRMHFGIDFTDESFYAASALRFANGALPLVDEINLGALCEWLVAPVLHISGGDAGGSVLLLRWTHLLFSIGVGGVVMFALWPYCKPGESILFGILPIAFVPFSIPMPSYNTLGVGLFTCGSVLVFRLQQRPDRRFAIAAGFSHALATLARPELVVGTAATVCTLILGRTERDQRKLALPYLCGALSVGIVLAAYLGVIGPSRLAESFAYMNSFGSAELSATKFLSSLRACLNLLLQPQESASSLAWVFWASFITFPVFIFLRRSLEARRVLLSVAIPSIVGGFAVAAASTNGFINMPIGWFPSLLVVLALFMPKSRPFRILPFGAVLVFILILSVAQAAVYRDERLSKLDSIVSHGAWAGIRTTRGRLQFIEDVRRDIQTAAKNRRANVPGLRPVSRRLSSFKPSAHNQHRLVVRDRPFPKVRSHGFASIPGSPARLARSGPPHEAHPRRWRSLLHSELPSVGRFQPADRIRRIRACHQSSKLHPLCSPPTVLEARHILETGSFTEVCPQSRGLAELSGSCLRVRSPPNPPTSRQANDVDSLTSMFHKINGLFGAEFGSQFVKNLFVRLINSFVIVFRLEIFIFWIGPKIFFDGTIPRCAFAPVINLQKKKEVPAGNIFEIRPGNGPPSVIYLHCLKNLVETPSEKASLALIFSYKTYKL